MKIVEQTQTRLQLEAKPFTAWFFASAQLIAGLAFAYAYISTMPDSSNQVALASIVFLGFSILTFIRSSVASIIFDKTVNQLLLIRRGILWNNRQEFPISDISAVSLVGFGGLNSDKFWDIVVSIRQGRNTVSLANPSTDKDNLTRITEVINAFLND
ncbi:hypothetical protein QUA30_20670 [Microcoleus sp. Pol14C2]|uniref:hypothetical protein n=1 Tax=unclassified Microcoleus TaxID=2642155 RepID=UPI002FCF679A